MTMEKEIWVMRDLMMTKQNFSEGFITIGDLKPLLPVNFSNPTSGLIIFVVGWYHIHIRMPDW